MNSAILTRSISGFKLNSVNKSFWLSKLCDDNYQKLAQLVPFCLSRLADDLVGVASGGAPDLLFKRIDSSPYTLTIQLTHRFFASDHFRFEPGLVIRVYLDTCSIEALYDHERAGAKACQPFYNAEMLAHKWELNYFLSLWLDYCLSCDYQFEQVGDL